MKMVGRVLVIGNEGGIQSPGSYMTSQCWDDCLIDNKGSYDVPHRCSNLPRQSLRSTDQIRSRCLSLTVGKPKGSMTPNRHSLRATSHERSHEPLAEKPSVGQRAPAKPGVGLVLTAYTRFSSVSAWGGPAMGSADGRDGPKRRGCSYFFLSTDATP
jgi:hypothetical protein